MKTLKQRIADRVSQLIGNESVTRIQVVDNLTNSELVAVISDELDEMLKEIEQRLPPKTFYS
jgi:hypothetical protein